MTSESPKPAIECASMEDVRFAIDALDRDIVALFGQRMRYIEAAARIKPDRGAVRDEARKADVIAKACAEATKVDFPEALTRQIYEILVEGSIAHEFEAFDRR